jgi:hypothetical protein
MTSSFTFSLPQYTPCLGLPGNKDWSPTDKMTINFEEVPDATSYRVYFGGAPSRYQVQKRKLRLQFNKRKKQRRATTGRRK